jgi:hypothetical protein
MSDTAASQPHTIARTRVKLSWVEWVDRSLHSHAIRLVLFALVANTIMAQAFFNSAGRILVLGGVNLTGLYLNVSSIFSTFAFSLFEIAMLWARQEVLSLDESIKKQIGAKEWLRRNLVTLVVISLINFYSLTVFNAAIWPVIRVPGIPEPPAPWKFYLHAGFYTVILYLAGIVGERVRSEQEMTMTMARKHTQQALAGHDAQVQQQIRDMTARGEPLAPLAAATSSPETAQLIALQSLVLAGKVDVMEAARMNVAATGGDTALLDRLHHREHQDASLNPISVANPPAPLSLSISSIPDAAVPTVIDSGDEDEEEDELGPVPSMRYSAKRITARLDATR